MIFILYVLFYNGMMEHSPYCISMVVASTGNLWPRQSDSLEFRIEELLCRMLCSMNLLQSYS